MGLGIGDIFSILSPAFGMGYKGAQDANRQANQAQGRARTGMDMYQALENVYAPWMGRGWTGMMGTPGPTGPGSKLAATQGRGGMGGGGGMMPPMPGMGGGMGGMGGGGGIDQMLQQMIQRRISGGR